MISIPGRGDESLALNVIGMDAESGAFTLSTTRVATENVPELMAALNDCNANSLFSTGLSFSGLINGQGVQVSVLDVARGEDGGCTMKTTIIFD